MLTSILSSALFLVSTLMSVSAAPLGEPVIKKRANGKVAAYFGQIKLASDDSLAKYCASSSVDIIVLAFMNIYQGQGGLPGTNFGPYENGVIPGTDLATVSTWDSDIKTCQANGKLVLLSLGGATGTQIIDSDEASALLANQAWNLFGEGTGLQSQRPFGSAVLDGFDLDIESNDPRGWPNFISTMRSLYATGSKKYYLSAAPQCPMPDASIGTSVYLVDFLFVQFYNNFCGGSQANVVSSFQLWSSDIAANSEVGGLIFVGLPGATNAGSGFLDTATMTAAVNAVKGASNYGGVMTWDASYASNNNNYLAALKSAA